MTSAHAIVKDVIADFKQARAFFRDALGTMRLDTLLDDADRIIPPQLTDTPYPAIQLALISDVFHILREAIYADGEVSPDEHTLAQALCLSLARPYCRALKGPYARFENMAPESALEFLATHQEHGTFPGSYARPWLSIRVAIALGNQTGDIAPREAVVRLAMRLVDSVISLGGVNEAERALRQRLKQALAVLYSPPPKNRLDPRIQAFLSPEAPEVFQSTAYMNHVHRPDPYDVEDIHADARTSFERSLGQIGLDATSGRVLLVLGEAGSGKTHLMRAFRNRLHGDQRGPFESPTTIDRTSPPGSPTPIPCADWDLSARSSARRQRSALPQRPRKRPSSVPRRTSRTERRPFPMWRTTTAIHPPGRPALRIRKV